MPDTAAIEMFCGRLERLVAIDSPSGGIEQEQVAAELLGWLAPLGVSHRWIDELDNPARSLAVTLPGNGGPAVSLLGHTDTVFPLARPASDRSGVRGTAASGQGWPT